MMIKPLTVLAAAALLAVPTAADAHTRTGATPPATADTLRGAAHGTGVRIGTAVDMSALGSDAEYRATVAREFSSVTAENVMKWESIHPEPDRYDWAAADRLVDEARRNGQVVRGHTLVWHSQNPAWLTSGDFTPAQLRQILRRHILDVVGHFRGRVYQWDVVNEVFEDDGSPRDTIWLRALGPGYIADAFRWAHQADPRAALYVNDYNNEGLNPKSDAYYELVKQLRAERVPVHGYGMQGHLAIQYGLPSGVPENIRRFERLGLQSAFTEVDVRMPLPADPIKLQAQAQGFTHLLTACLLAERCVSYTVWGFTDRYSWVPGVFEGEGAATPLDENYGPKPAYAALRDTLRLAGR